MKILKLEFDQFPVLETERMLLKKITAKEVEEVFFLRSDDEVMRYIDRPRAATLEDAIAFIARTENDYETQNGITWGIYSKTNPDTLIGYLGYWRMVKESFRSETGYALHPAYHGKGLTTEALLAILKFGFEVIGFHSIEANINPDNDASRKVLLKTGFVKEAYFRENYYFNGRFLDSEIYSLLASEFNARSFSK